MRPIKSHKHLNLNKGFIFLISVALLIFLVLFPVVSSYGSTRHIIPLSKHPAPIYNLVLSEPEISVPFDGYHKDDLGERTIKLDQPAPRVKPEVQWSRKVKLHFPDPMVVDREGGTWFLKTASSDDEDHETAIKLRPRPAQALIRLNPDNSISWKRYSDRFRENFPVIVCNDAVIWLIKTFNTPYSQSEVSLECVDNDGIIIWRTQIMNADFEHYFSNLVWRISGNRIMLATGLFNLGTFKIFSLSDGTLLETIVFPEWNSGGNVHKPLEPIEIPNKGWIGFQEDSIVLYNLNLETIWKHKIEVKELMSQPLILKDILIWCTTDYLAAININSGEIVWKQINFKNTELFGAEPSYQYIILTAATEFDKSRQFYIIDSTEKVIFSTPYKTSIFNYVNRNNHSVVYGNGEVLFSDGENLNLIDKNGNFIWRLSLKDLGFSTEAYTIQDSLNLAPDGRFVFCVTSDDLDADKTYYIISLKTMN